MSRTRGTAGTDRRRGEQQGRPDDQLPSARPAYPSEYQRPEPGSWPRPSQDDYGWQQQRLGFPDRDPYASPSQDSYGSPQQDPYGAQDPYGTQDSYGSDSYGGPSSQDYRPQPVDRPSYDQRSDYEPSRGDYDQRDDRRRDLPEPPPGSGHVHRGGPVGPNLPTTGAPGPLAASRRRRVPASRPRG
ncbi:Chromosomal replication initiator protein DnaA OS=Streptomyces albaduncus OX=68172 GN=dnaA PE=3 SV=1 [Streptomyces griseoloalbus]